MKILILFIVLCFDSVQATTSDILANEGSNSLLGRANSSTNAGAYASKTNPASLVLTEKPLVDFNLSLTNPNLQDPDLVLTAPSSGISKDDYKASEAESLKGYSIGLALPLSKKISIGFSAFLSANALIRIYTQTSNESPYLRFNDRQQRPEIYSGLGYKIFDELAVGFGLFYSMKASGVFQMGVSTSDAEARSLLEAEPVMIPYGGLLYDKKLSDSRKLLLGLTYRGPNDPETSVSFELRQSFAGGTIPINADSTIIAFYDPAQINLGAGFETPTSSSYLNLERVFWSNYNPPVVSIGGNDIDTLISKGVKKNTAEFRDVWAIRAGQVFKNLFNVLGGKYTQLLGLEYHQGAIKKDTNSISVLDTDKYIFNVGAQLGYNQFLDIKKPVKLYMGLKYIKLKDETFSSNGQLLSAGGNIMGIIGGFNIEI